MKGKSFILIKIDVMLPNKDYMQPKKSGLCGKHTTKLRSPTFSPTDDFPKVGRQIKIVSDFGAEGPKTP